MDVLVSGGGLGRIDFLLSAHRDAAAAKRFFQKALCSPNHPTPRVINVDKSPSYPPVVED
jgi:transposase-like protein